MAKMTGSEFAEYYVSGMKNSLEKIRRGIDGVTEAPGKKAAQKRKEWAAKLAQPETQEKWERNVAAVSLEEWKTKARDVGVNRISAGVEAARDLMAKFGEQLLAYEAAGLPKIHAMPSLTYADTKARMDAWFDYMTKFRFRR
jgi:hypothetical protein